MCVLPVCAACHSLLLPLPVGVSSPIRLMQAGLAYVSVHTSQSGQSPEMRGQLVSYGRVMGNSAAIAK
jgi:hypothetical protein